MNEERKKRFGLLKMLAVAPLLLTVLYFGIFPGRQATMAFTLASGIGVSRMQARVDRLEDMAIQDSPFSASEKRYLHDLYSCFAKGGRLTFVLRQTGAIMAHYLSGKGTPYKTGPRIFVNNRKVRKEMTNLKTKALDDAKRRGKAETEYTSSRFYMPDPSCIDSVFGLYIGRLILRPAARPDGRILLKWRAEVPWEWPSYESQIKENGDPHAKYSWVPNVQALLRGHMRGLKIDDGLGEYLVRLGLAKPFLLYSEWEEALHP
jgi:hypothetical protein